MSAFPGHLQALLSAGAYPHRVAAVELVQTHVSWILLTGEFAYKIKRPVQYSFVDQRSLAQRCFLCQEELRLNRRFAPELYLAVCAISAPAGVACLGEAGPIVEYAVRMRQFSRAEELDRLLEAGDIQPAELETFGRELARIHARLPVADPRQRWGEPQALAPLVNDNLEDCAREAAALGGLPDRPALRAALESRLDSTLQRRGERLAHGRVRECHGDLHAGNIVRYGSRLVAFDCLEFDAGLRWIDLADEIAFLLADLRARGHGLPAQAFLNGYLTESGDYEACVLLPLYQAHRALVRAKITALSASQASASRESSLTTARRVFEAYLDSVRGALAPRQPVLVLICGLSGSGKTWLAQQLAPPLSAVHLRSDIERKRLAGLGAQDSSGSQVGEGLYSDQASRGVYERLAECTTDILRGGYTTIVDATFGRAEDRMRFRALATSLSTPVCVVYCRAPQAVLEARILQRQQQHDDPSEADLAVLAWQETRFEPPLLHEGASVLEFQSQQPDALAALVRRITLLRV